MNRSNNIVIAVGAVAVIVGLGLSVHFYREAALAREMAQQSRAEAEMNRERTQAATDFLQAAQ